MRMVNNFSRSRESLVDRLIRLKEMDSIDYLKFREKFCISTCAVDGIYADQEDFSVKNFNDIINSLDVFDFVIDTIDQELTVDLIKEFHKLLKKDTVDEYLGLSGCFKKSPINTFELGFRTSEPNDVEMDLQKILTTRVDSPKEICKFHVLFEHICPFESGNGIIGRFLMMRQFIQIDKFPLLINDKNSKEYKRSLKTSSALFSFYNKTGKIRF